MPDDQQQLEGGAYEVIRGRLETHGGDLRQRLDQLNADRRELFGAIETELLSTERVTTAHNCVPRDMIAIGERKGRTNLNGRAKDDVGPSQIGWYFEEVSERAADRVPPAFIDIYGVDWVVDPR